ncbi:4067_t:CDS:2, partial [Acaulospora morrowiae]
PYQPTSYYPGLFPSPMATQQPNYRVPPNYQVHAQAPPSTQQCPPQQQLSVIGDGGVNQQMPPNQSTQSPYKSPLTFDAGQPSNQPYNFSAAKTDAKVESSQVVSDSSLNAKKKKNTKLKQGLAVAGAAGAGLIGGFLAGEAMESRREQQFEDLYDAGAELEREKERGYDSDNSDDFSE